VWYRDTTLRTVTFTRLVADSTLPMLAGVQFQLRSPTQVVLLSPEAMREQDRGYRHLQAHQWAAAVASLVRADSLEPDPAHQVFHGNNAGYRSLAYLQLRQVADAEQDARRAFALDERDKNGGRVLVSSLMIQGRLPEAAAALVQVERIYPNEPWVATLRADLESMRREAAGGAVPPPDPNR
jgi:Flp pilus assembly protein TadD